MPIPNSRKLRQRRRVVMMLQRHDHAHAEMIGGSAALPVDEFAIVDPANDCSLSSSPADAEILDWNDRPTHGRIVAKMTGQERKLSHRVTGHPIVVIGSDPACDFSFTDAGLAEQHACFLFVDRRIYCVDLTGKYSLKVRGGRFQQIWVHDGSYVEIGKLRLRVHTDVDAAEDASPTEAKQASESARRYLELTKSGGEAPWRYEMTRNITLIGRDPPSTIRLKDPALSAVSAALVQTPAGVWYVDLEPRPVHHTEAIPRCRPWPPGEAVPTGRFRIQLFEESDASTEQIAIPHTTTGL